MPHDANMEQPGDGVAIGVLARQMMTALSDLETYGYQTLLWALVLGSVFWTALFYLCCWHWRVRMAHVPPSTKPHENDVYWCARNVIGIIHAIVVSLIAVPAGLAFLSVPAESKFCSAVDIGTCHVYPEDGDLCYRNVATECYWLALAGVLFTSFAISDTIVSAIHELATPDHWVHHIAFITAGLIIRTNCMLPFNAAVLMAMEVSTPFLNYMLLMRHRGDQYTTAVTVCGSLFFVFFILFRLVFNTYGAVVLWYFRDTAMPARVPQWQVWFLLLAVTAGAALQFFWFPNILSLFVSKLKLLLVRNGTNGSTDHYAPLDK